MVGAIIGLLVVGLVGGYVARAIIPGNQKMTLFETVLLGIVGSFLGGAMSWLIFDTDGGFIQAASWLGSIAGATLALGLRTMFDDYRHRAVTR